MITTGALIHGQRDRLLRFDPLEHPVALQIGGSEPNDLARVAAWGEQAGYDEINLNCGCPSERVQRGAFGACLMAEPDRVADCVRAMREVVKVPVTVKHRIGLDQDESYDFVVRFVDQVAQAGCNVFIVHARNAWLKGLSPKENREVPPLRYETVYRLKRDFPSLTIVINGGMRSYEEALRQLDHVDGVMLGRAACDDPWLLARVDSCFYGAADPTDDRLQVLEAIRPFLADQVLEGVSARAVLRHVMGLFNGLPGARAWRRTLSDSETLAHYGAGTLDQALARMLRT